MRRVEPVTYGMKAECSNHEAENDFQIGDFFKNITVNMYFQFFVRNLTADPNWIPFQNPWKCVTDDSSNLKPDFHTKNKTDDFRIKNKHLLF
jgi:hypothetical protein